MVTVRRVIFMCGPLGAGKSPYKQRFESESIVRLSFDVGVALTARDHQLIFSAGCGTVAVSWAETFPSKISLHRILPSNREKKRADERTRTADLLITSELLYLLSYVGLFRCVSISYEFEAFRQSLTTE